MKKLLLPAKIVAGTLAVFFYIVAFAECFISSAYSRACDFTGMLFSLLFLFAYVIFLILFRKSRSVLIVSLILSLFSIYMAINSQLPHTPAPYEPPPLHVISFLDVVFYILHLFVVFAYIPLSGLSYFFQSHYGDFYQGSYLVFYTVLVALLLVLKLFLLGWEIRRRRRAKKEDAFNPSNIVEQRSS